MMRESFLRSLADRNECVDAHVYLEAEKLLHRFWIEACHRGSLVPKPFGGEEEKTERDVSLRSAPRLGVGFALVLEEPDDPRHRLLALFGGESGMHDLVDVGDGIDHDRVEDDHRRR